MSLFNKSLKKKTVKTINRAGGQAFVQNAKMRLVSILLTSFAKDQFYRTADQTFEEVIKLLPQVDPKFAAKAGIYARTVYGMRSISHVLAAELSAHVSGQPWAKSFYHQIVSRPDDMQEIAAYYYHHGGKTLPNAMKKGFATAFGKFDGYQLAKYRGERKMVKLIDLANLVHPIPTPGNARALEALVNGSLKSVDTWEAKLTKAGQVAVNDKEKKVLKAKAWKEMVKEKKIGYFALLRNLRNIATEAPKLTTEVCKLLTDKNRIQRSKVMPFRYLMAMDALKDAKLENNRQLLAALDKALEIAVSNVPVFDGKTLVVLDDSGSMTWGQKSMNKTPIELGAIFASVLFKSNNADLMRFSDDASYVNMHFGDAISSISSRLIKNAKSAGTNFHAIFEQANKAYDRIIILSDMQGWIGHYSPKNAFEDYKRKYNANPFIYSFDLQGYGSSQFPENKIFCLTGFSEKVLDMMQLLETDRNALITEIEKIQL